MIASSNRVDLSSHLTLLCILFQLFGYSDFNYSRSARQVTYSRRRSRKSQIVFKFLTIVCGIMFVLMLYASILSYFNFHPVKHTTLKSLDVQESVHRHLSYAAEYLSIVILAVNYMGLRRSLLRTINDMFDIFKRLERNSDSRIYFPVPFAVFIIFKIALFSLSLLSGISGNVKSIFLLLDITASYGQILQLLMFMGHVYSQLVLIFFYSKMNETLQITLLNKDQLAIKIRKFLALSFHIHQVNRKLNAFFSALFLTSFLGLFSDTLQLYGIFRLVCYHKFHENRIIQLGEYIFHINWRPLLMLRMSYDIYLIGRLSDMLVQSERAFKQRIMLLIYNMRLTTSTQLVSGNNRLRVRINLYSTNYRTGRAIKSDRGFFFDVIIIISVITLFHYYATDLIRIRT